MTIETWMIALSLTVGACSNESASATSATPPTPSPQRDDLGTPANAVKAEPAPPPSIEGEWSCRWRATDGTTGTETVTFTEEDTVTGIGQGVVESLRVKYSTSYRGKRVDGRYELESSDRGKPLWNEGVIGSKGKTLTLTYGVIQSGKRTTALGTSICVKK